MIVCLSKSRIFIKHWVIQQIGVVGLGHKVNKHVGK